MDKSIAETFKEKNAEILLNKIIQDIENNDDSLKLTVQNKISLAINKVTRLFNSFLKENGIDNYEFKTLSEMFNDIEQTIKKIVFDLLDERMNSIINYVKSHEKLKEDGLTVFLQKVYDDFKSKLDIVMNEEIYVNIPEKISLIITFNNNEQKNLILEKINQIDIQISGFIEEAVIERNNTLKNIIVDNCVRIKDLEEKTAGKFRE